MSEKQTQYPGSKGKSLEILDTKRDEDSISIKVLTEKGEQYVLSVNSKEGSVTVSSPTGPIHRFYQTAQQELSAGDSQKDEPVPTIPSESIPPQDPSHVEIVKAPPDDDSVLDEIFKSKTLESMQKALNGATLLWSPWTKEDKGKPRFSSNRFINEWGFEWGGELDPATQQPKTEGSIGWKPAFISGIVHSGLGHLLGEAWRKDHQSARPVPTRATTNKTEEVSVQKMEESIISKVMSSLAADVPQPAKVVETPFSKIKAQLQADPGFAWGWHCNLACAYTGAATTGVLEVTHAAFIGNRAAESFMSTTFDVDMRKNQLYRDWMRDYCESNPEFMAAFWAQELARLKPYCGEIYIEECRKFYFGE